MSFSTKYYGTMSQHYEFVHHVGQSTSCLLKDISNLEAGNTYYFVVTAVDSFNNESKPSVELIYNIPENSSSIDENLRVTTSSDVTITATNEESHQEINRVSTGLLLLYTFNENSGTTVHDISGVGTPLEPDSGGCFSYKLDSWWGDEN